MFLSPKTVQSSGKIRWIKHSTDQPSMNCNMFWRPSNNIFLRHYVTFTSNLNSHDKNAAEIIIIVSGIRRLKKKKKEKSQLDFSLGSTVTMLNSSPGCRTHSSLLRTKTISWKALKQFKVQWMMILCGSDSLLT